MKVTYEFQTDIDNDDYYQVQIYQRAPNMYSALCNMERYLWQVKKYRENPNVDEIMDNLLDMIFDSKIGEIE